MKNWLIIFKIDNNQEDYASCLRVIDAVEGKQQSEVAGNDFLKKVICQRTEQWINLKNVLNAEFTACETSLLEIAPDDKCRFFFEVNCTEADDIINLIYYCLINDRIEGKGILGVKCQRKLQFNIQDLLSDMLLSGELKEYYILENDKYYLIDKRNIKIRRNRRFSPILK